MLRNITLRRAVASFFLLELVGSTAAPTLSYALMGPGQPEFTSFESAGSPDMVNLSTGDMTYNVPVLEVPGPETTFSLPLTYRAGIRPEQEASWVGLGWGMNPGAIVRNVNGYPDDASGELATNSYSDPGHHGWYGGVPGILNLGWDSETGHSGSASLLGFVNASWSGGKLQSGDVIGLGANRGQIGLVNPVAFAAAVITVATAGVGASLSVGAKVGLQAGGALATGVGIAAFGKSGPSGGGFNRPTVVKNHTWFRTNYWVFVNDTTKEAMFGSLYFDQLSKKIDTNFGDFANANNYGPDVFDGTTNYQNNLHKRKGYKFSYKRDFTDNGNFVREMAADMQQYTNPAGAGYVANTQNPLSIAHDDFTVMGAGVSGTIRPQRLDVGSLAYPRQMLTHHDKYSLVPWESYKVPFRYDNTASNTYTYGATADATTQPAGIDASHWGSSQLVITDPKIYDATQNGAAVRTEPSRKGLTARRLAQGKQVEWYTNKEIADAYDTSPATQPIAEFSADVAGTDSKRILTGYTTTVSPDHQLIRTPTYETRTVTSKNLFRRLRPENSIGAFAVTAEDGTVYHYSLPVYHLRQYSKTLETGDPLKGVAINSQGARGKDLYNYATAWLLTSITGPDYVDQGTIGVVDDQDLGTWVAFSYGKFSSQFKWRQPYVGTEIGPDAFAADGFTKTNAYTFQEGAKETYYLNSIRTRTHTALFIKSVRQDGRGHYTAGTAGIATASNLGIDERTPSSSLRLDEVVVLSNPDLAALQASTGFGVNTKGNATIQSSGDSFAAVLDQNDISAVSTVRTTLNQKALKRVVFNYSYRLCPGTPNSFADATAPPVLGTTYTAAGRFGKLTLESIATYGANSVKLIPDFRFDYGNNPAYDPNKWDAFGMYASQGTATTTSHRPAEDFAVATQDGAAWSLTKITNPLGSTTELTYERDQYAYVSEFPAGSYKMTHQSSGGSTTGPTGLLQGSGKVDLTTVYQVGRSVHVRGNFTDIYQLTITTTNPTSSSTTTREVPCPYYVDADFTIGSVSANTVGLIIPPAGPNPNSCVPQNTYNSGITTTYSGTTTGKSSYDVTISGPFNRNGGDLRVAAVTTRDEAGQTYVVKYQYTNSDAKSALTNSSGVISKEPEYVRNKLDDYPFYPLFDYPATPVMYGQTTVLRGNFATPDDIDQREEYAFYTATSSMVRPIKKTTETIASYPFLSGSGPVALRQQNNDVAVDIGLLGQAKSIRKYNRRGTLEFSTVFQYATSLPNADGIANQGTFSESTLTSEFLNVDNNASTGAVYNLNWTTKRYLPTVLRSITTTTNNVAATTTNQTYDFFTGAVLQTNLTNSIGDVYLNKTVPAYTLYAGMGPKTEAAGNQHMLTQVAATYAYKQTGTTSAVLAASIQTWNNAWSTYRRYDAASDSYKSDPQASVPIWRQHRTYLWQSPQLNADGSYANFVDYNWQPQATQASKWLNVGEVTLYDHYSRPLESKDVNGYYAAQKVGYDQSQVLASAQNARYTELAYSGAEDAQTVSAGITHFGGEVRGGGQQSTQQHHTGQYSSLLTAASPLGFTYKALVGNVNEVSTDRTYRVSVWVHDSDTQGNARLYVALNGTTVQEVNCLDATTRRAGNWLLLNLYVPLPASATGQQLTVGCRNAGAADVYVDDFRFHPLDAPLQAMVYDPATRQPLWMLDNDNLYTHYQYDAAGKVVKVYREVLTAAGSTAPAERVVKESSYNYAQMRTPTWIETGLTCVSGQQYRIVRDANTESPTYNQTQQQATGKSCTP